MNSCKIFLSIMFIVSEAFQDFSYTPISAMNFNVLHRNTETIHTTMNKMFKSLKLRKSFKESTKIRLLLTMHKNLISILRNSYKNREVDNNADNITIKEYPNNNIIDEILEEEHWQQFFSPNETAQNSTANSDGLTEHVTWHLQQFLLKIDEIKKKHQNINNDTLSDKNSTNTQNKTLTRRSGRRMTQLKSWIPDADQNLTNSNRRIYNSKRTKIKKYPFMASVHLSGDFVCAGSIISRDLIITSASCLQIAYLHRHNQHFKSNVSVRIGSDFATHGGEFVAISQIYFHPLYNPENLKNNLAILRMSKHQHFSKKRKIRRIVYDKTTGDLANNVNKVTIVGWGAKNELNLQDPSTKLSLGHLDLYDLGECKAVYSTFYVNEQNFCAGFISKGSGACDKDVGDPAVVAGVLVGVVSFGPPLCGTPDAPTVFTRLGMYVNWIDGIIRMDPTKITKSKPILRMPIVRSSTQKRKGVYGLGRISFDYPEDFFILNKILTDISRPNAYEVKDLINEGFNKEIFEDMVTPRMDMRHHPLANRSVFGMSGINFPDQKYATKQKKIVLGTTPNVLGINLAGPKIDFNDYVDTKKLGEMLEVLYHQHMSHLLPTSKHPIPVATRHKWIGRNGDVDINRPMMTTPLFDEDDGDVGKGSDASSENYEETDSDEGMSIEVKRATIKPIYGTTQLVTDSGENNNKDYDDKNVKTTAKLSTTKYDDYLNIFFALGKKAIEDSDRTNNEDEYSNPNNVVWISEDEFNFSQDPESIDLNIANTFTRAR